MERFIGPRRMTERVRDALQAAVDRAAHSFTLDGNHWVGSEFQLEGEPHTLQRDALVRACEMLRLEAPPMWLDGDAPEDYRKKRQRILRAEAEGKFVAKFRGGATTAKAKQKWEARRARFEAANPELLKYVRMKVTALRALAEQEGDAAAAEELERRQRNAAEERENVEVSARRGEEWAIDKLEREEKKRTPVKELEARGEKKTTPLRDLKAAALRGVVKAAEEIARRRSLALDECESILAAARRDEAWALDKLQKQKTSLKHAIESTYKY